MAHRDADGAGAIHPICKADANTFCRERPQGAQKSLFEGLIDWVLRALLSLRDGHYTFLVRLSYKASPRDCGISDREFRRK